MDFNDSITKQSGDKANLKTQTNSSVGLVIRDDWYSKLSTFKVYVHGWLFVFWCLELDTFSVVEDETIVTLNIEF